MATARWRKPPGRSLFQYRNAEASLRPALFFSLEIIISVAEEIGPEDEVDDRVGINAEQDGADKRDEKHGADAHWEPHGCYRSRLRAGLAHVHHHDHTQVVISSNFAVNRHQH